MTVGEQQTGPPRSAIVRPVDERHRIGDAVEIELPDTSTESGFIAESSVGTVLVEVREHPVYYGLLVNERRLTPLAPGRWRLIV